MNEHDTAHDSDHEERNEQVTIHPVLIHELALAIVDLPVADYWALMGRVESLRERLTAAFPATLTPANDAASDDQQTELPL